MYGSSMQYQVRCKQSTDTPSTCATQIIPVPSTHPPSHPPAAKSSCQLCRRRPGALGPARRTRIIGDPLRHPQCPSAGHDDLAPSTQTTQTTFDSIKLTTRLGAPLSVEPTRHKRFSSERAGCTAFEPRRAEQYEATMRRNQYPVGVSVWDAEELRTRY